MRGRGGGGVNEKNRDTTLYYRFFIARNTQMLADQIFSHFTLETDMLSKHLPSFLLHPIVKNSCFLTHKYIYIYIFANTKSTERFEEASKTKKRNKRKAESLRKIHTTPTNQKQLLFDILHAYMHIYMCTI